MTWNLSAECISCVIVSIILVYSRQGSPLPSFKNKIFDICLMTTFVAISTNILSTLMIYNLQRVPVWLTWLVTMVYFVATPLMGTVYFFYILAVIYEGNPHIRRYLLLGGLPAALYLIDVFLTPFTGAIFTLSREAGYLRGPHIAITYIIFYLYCVLCIVFALRRSRNVDFSIRRILAIFPLIAVVVILVQQAYPTYILSGSAATCALLIVYLYLQNKRISIDYLTGISNRQEFLQMLSYKIRSRRLLHFTVVVISLNQFKVINDKLGQHNGDKLLQQLSAYLKTESSLGALYRYSGDEFALLMDTVEADIVHKLVMRIMKRMESPWALDSYGYMMSCSVGIVEYPLTADDVSGLVNGIEYAVDQAKADKVEKVCLCTPKMLEQFRRRSQILEILQEKVRDNSFEVYLQPILNSGTQRFCAAEALLRLLDTPLGTISPGEFIPLAEESGIIIDITYQLLEKVCGQIRSLQEAGAEFDWISVNLSVLQLMQPNLPEKICRIIERCGVPYSKVKLEITESVLAASFQKVEEFIRAMDKVGIQCALDDFGTGYSNIAMSIQLPLDTIKLDQSLVWSGFGDSRAAVIVHNTSQAIRQLGIHVVAEGVETEAQARFVEQCGCDLIQGFLYARPMPFEQARTYFEP